MGRDNSPVLKGKLLFTPDITRWMLMIHISKEPQEAKKRTPSIIVFQTGKLLSNIECSSLGMSQIWNLRNLCPRIMILLRDMSHLTNVKRRSCSIICLPWMVFSPGMSKFSFSRRNNQPNSLYCTVKPVWPMLLRNKSERYGSCLPRCHRSQFERWNFRCGTMLGPVHQSGEYASIRITLSFLSQVRHASLYLRLDL